ncbi:hypothetical protein AQPE_4974 [Aquipluma nitroreducens]|uniref:Uncharacterized protein n=1 Tax=Aquipluma nitroreducens TaxID=2010828 RepID=A0A5K7SGM7_9BACT|nr:hypothetical protein AQPE_4974 [Aquipluma nitroreducens]
MNFEILKKDDLQWVHPFLLSAKLIKENTDLLIYYLPFNL